MVSDRRRAHPEFRQRNQEKVERPRCRVVLRSYGNAHAYGGLVYSYANYAASNANTNNGVRLTLRTIIEANIRLLLYNRHPATVMYDDERDEESEPRQPLQTSVWRKPEHY